MRLFCLSDVIFTIWHVLVSINVGAFDVGSHRAFGLEVGEYPLHSILDRTLTQSAMGDWCVPLNPGTRVILSLYFSLHRKLCLFTVSTWPGHCSKWLQILVVSSWCILLFMLTFSWIVWCPALRKARSIGFTLYMSRSVCMSHSWIYVHLHVHHGKMIL